MRIFSAIYDKVLSWAEHPHAPYYLVGLSFTEASFFPIPPDLMLAPMALSQPKRAWWYATLTTIFSVLGGLFGYLLGMFFITLIEPAIIYFGYLDTYHTAQSWFQTWGFWALLCAGFTPIPYKLFTIAGGALGMSIFPFIAASIIGRGGRFFLVSALILMGGEKMKNALRRYIDWLGWLLLVIIMVAYIIIHYLK
jgi:membrane protein YqaA with SNARE-associated domain